MRTLLLDLGSHSAKAYVVKNGPSNKLLDEVGVMTWSLLESESTHSTLESVLERMVMPHRENCQRFLAVGTEAMRRNPKLSERTSLACTKLGIVYRTLTQDEEASLIKKAVPAASGFDIINAGGGSIQIVSGKETTLALLTFGISDLNRMFALTEAPEKRKTRECIEWVFSHLPEPLERFVYTGGEAKYLRKMGVPLVDGLCEAKNFERLASHLSKLKTEELEKLSPYDPKWMRGAIASNCIVLACLKKSGSRAFIPSDVNIAHGLIQGASEE